VQVKRDGVRGLWRDVVSILKCPSFTWSTMGFTAVTFSAGSSHPPYTAAYSHAQGALGQWAPTFVSRQSEVYGKPYSISEASLFFGGIACISGVGGTCLSNTPSQLY
jgi:hypothetical protein